MKELFKLEFRKLRKQKSMYICLAIMLCMIFLAAIVYKVLMASSVSIDMGDFMTDLNNVDAIFFTLTTISNADFFIVLGIVVAITFCFDFEEHTIRNIFAKGYSRTTSYFSKLVSIICSTAFMFVCCYVFAFGVGALFFGVGEGNLLTMLGLIGLQFLVCLAYATFFTFICVLCKKMSIAITVNIIAPLAIILLMMLADALVKFDTFKISGCWLDGMITNLSTLPASSTSIVLAVVGSIMYIAIFVTCGAILNRKTEV